MLKQKKEKNLRMDKVIQIIWHYLGFKHICDVLQTCEVAVKMVTLLEKEIVLLCSLTFFSWP